MTRRFSEISSRGTLVAKGLALVAMLVITQGGLLSCPFLPTTVTDPCDDVICANNEPCVNGLCVADDPCADVACDVDETCVNGDCVVDTPVDLCEGVVCDDGDFCNGTETCDPDTGDCLAGTAPCDAATETCNEGTDTCDPIVGKALVLTNGIDVNLPATAVDDTLVGTYASVAATDTINLGDDIDLAGGTDTFTVIGTATPIPPIDVRNTENINVRVAGVASTWNVANVTGATKFTFNNGSTNLTLQNIQNNVDLGINGGTGTEVFTAQFVDTVVNTAADAVNVMLDDCDIATLDLEGVTNTEGFETVNFMITGDNEVSRLDSGDTDLDTINITGDSSLKLADATPLANATTIDASGLGGDLDVTIGAGNIVTVTGGAGDDRIAFSTAADFTTADTVSGGTSGTDTLAIADTAVANGTDLATAVAAAATAGFDILELTAAGAITNLDMNETGSITDIAITGNGAAAVTVNNQADADTYLLDNADRTTVTFNPENPGANTLNLTQSDGDAIATNLAAGAIETINIASTGDAANSVALLTAPVNASITITGTRDYTITALAAAGIIDANAFTGILTVTGSAGNDTIIGGTQADVINCGDGDDAATGNGGADRFQYDEGDLSAAPGAGVFDSISDFEVGADIIDDTDDALTIITNAGPATAGTAEINAEGIATFHVDDDTLAERITAVEAAINAGGVAADAQFAIFELSGNSYVFMSDGVDAVGADDVLVRLTGVTGLSNTTLTGGNLTIN